MSDTAPLVEAIATVKLSAAARGRMVVWGIVSHPLTE
jgi:hypothetical protein